MNFKITARVVTQLGAELISSDEVAIYELVKNGFDAGSQAVEVNIYYRIEQQFIASQIEKVVAYERKSIEISPPLLGEIERQIVNLSTSKKAVYCLLSDDQLDALAKRIRAERKAGDLIELLGQVNTIDIVDYGRGMSADDVERYFLTIGTTHRLEQLEAIQRHDSKTTVPFGEKGIGRLSAMRLGNELSLFTVPSYAEESVFVRIPWRDFTSARNQDLANVPIFSERSKKGGAASGTVITVSDLVSNWRREKVEELGTNHLAKFIDPFPLDEGSVDATQNAPKRSVILRWNGELIQFAELLRVFLENAQNALLCRLQFTETGAAQLVTDFRFGASQTQPTKIYRRTYSTVDFAGITDEQLREVGPFEFQLYHFPRNRLKAIPQVATRQELKKWLDRWCGGLMVFRDGIRVLPYANADDDWLELDSKALRGHGFRVNRIQVVGSVRITRLANPSLTDQTNREGLRDNNAFQTFRRVIQRHIQENFVTALDQHLSFEKAEPEGLTHIMREKSELLSASVEHLAAAVSENDWKAVREVRGTLVNAVSGIAELHESVENLIKTKEGSRLEIIELAATGMTAEAMAHDLEGLIEGAVAALNDLAKLQSPKLVATVRHIRAVHKSLLTQVKQLSPGPARARRRSSTFDMRELIGDVANFYSERCMRHSISFNIAQTADAFLITAVNGHVRQIVDNLIRNSIFWLIDTKSKFLDRALEINVRLDSIARLITITDTGVGIAIEDATWVFQPFTTRRDTGRGLGLYICHELCEFNGIHLKLDLNQLNEWKRCATFVMEFPVDK